MIITLNSSKGPLRSNPAVGKFLTTKDRRYKLPEAGRYVQAYCEAFFFRNKKLCLHMLYQYTCTCTFQIHVPYLDLDRKFTSVPPSKIFLKRGYAPNPKSLVHGGVLPQQQTAGSAWCPFSVALGALGFTATTSRHSFAHLAGDADDTLFRIVRYTPPVILHTNHPY